MINSIISIRLWPVPIYRVRLLSCVVKALIIRPHKSVLHFAMLRLRIVLSEHNSSTMVVVLLIIKMSSFF